MKKTNEMTDREIQESLLNNSRMIIKQMKSIKGILTFFLIIVIIGIIVSLLGI